MKMLLVLKTSCQEEKINIQIFSKEEKEKVLLDNPVQESNPLLTDQYHREYDNSPKHL